MSRKQPFVHFDNPREHLGSLGHYQPPKARTAEEIARRKSLPKGTLLAEQQKLGIQLGDAIFGRVEEEPDVHYVAGTLAVVAFNTSWYTYARFAPDVMRRQQHLPKIADDEAETRMSRSELRDDIAGDFETAVDLAEVLVADRTAGRNLLRHNVSFGRFIGNMSLKLAALHYNVTATGGNAYEVQEQARAAALMTVEEARSMGARINAHPSFAQLAYPDSPLSVDWRRNAPNGALGAYDAALTELGMPPVL